MIPLRLQSRIALGLSPTPRPGLVLLPVGTALGPAGLNILSDRVLSYLDPAVSVALAALGVFAGLDVYFRERRESLLLGVATIEAGLAILFVALGVFVLSGVALAGSTFWLAAILFGISAAASSSVTGDDADRPPSRATRVGDLDDVLPIILSGIVLASVHRGLTPAALSLAAQAGLIAAVVALAGWLLVSQASAEGEQHVFTAGSLLLLGGAAAYLSTSALWVGFVGGLTWSVVARGTARASIDRDMRYLQHPLIVLLLLAAGAHLQFSFVVVGLTLVYLLCRTAAKLLGGWLAGRIVAEMPDDLGRRLIAPGVIAVAFAINVLQVSPDSDWAAPLLAVAVLGSLGSELLAVVADPERRPG